MAGFNSSAEIGGVLFRPHNAEYRRSLIRAEFMFALPKPRYSCWDSAGVPRSACADLAQARSTADLVRTLAPGWRDSEGAVSLRASTVVYRVSTAGKQQRIFNCASESDCDVRRVRTVADRTRVDHRCRRSWPTGALFQPRSSTVTTARGITLGAADEQIGQCEDAGRNSYRSSAVKMLERLAADPWALDRLLHRDPQAPPLRPRSVC
jgi:hypothetical protein